MASMRHLFLAICAAVALCNAAQAGRIPQSEVSFAIKQQPLQDALTQFGRQTGYQLLFLADVTADVMAPEVMGKFTPQSALEKLLANSGLRYQFVNERTITIQSSAAASSDASAGDQSSGDLRASERMADADSQLRLARSGADDSTSAGSAAQDEQKPAKRGEPSDERVEEIIVTAQKREERLQDVPAPVTAVNAELLAVNNQPQLRDYFSRIPGLNLTEGGIYGGSIISIRGITAGIFNDGTATVVVDDVSYGIASATQPGEVVPELDPAELVRLEVLRGPQGTLYGASSMGGLLKYVTARPSTDALTGYVRAGVSDVHNGDGTGYSVSGGINLPLGDSWALRASGFTRDDPGYISDPIHNLEGINSGQTVGGRLSLLWQPSEDFSLQLSALYQDAESDGNPYVGPVTGFGTLGDLEQVSPPGVSGYDKKLAVYTANVTARLGRVDLNTVSAYSNYNNAFRWDATGAFRATTLALFGVPSSDTVSAGETEKFTQEVRVNVPIGEKMDLLLGGFYVTEDNTRVARYATVDFATGAELREIGLIDIPTEFEEKALFSTLTYRFTDRFDVQVGGRYAENSQALVRQVLTGPLFGGGSATPRRESEDHSFTYLFTPRFRVNPNLMTYMRLASSYRPGGPNTSTSPLIPQTFRPDKTLNYEVGVKGSAFDGVLSFDASVYHIDWTDILLGSLVSPANRLNYKDNGGDAKSQGIDLSFDIRPLPGLKITAWGAWNVAELVEDFPSISTVRGSEGDRLPFSSRFSGSVSIEQEFKLREGLAIYAGATNSYVGARKGPFTPTTREDLPGYHNTDLNAGVRWSTWEANFYLNNVLDKRGLINGGLGGFVPSIFIYTRPRTGGVTVSKRF